jgi:hypothetical protein
MNIEELQLITSSYAVVLLAIIFKTGSHKKYILHWLVMVFFAVNNFIMICLDAPYLTFITVHIISFILLILISEYIYRKKKYRYALTANLFPVFIGIAFLFFSLLHKWVGKDTFLIVHSSFLIFIMTMFVATPYLAEFKRLRWMKQFLF